MHIELDKYASLHSPIHQWDPRFKIVSLVVLVIGYSFVKNIVLSPFMLVISILLALISRIPFSHFLKRLKHVLLFLIPMGILLCISSGGEILYAIGIFSVYKEGLFLSLFITVRTVAILMVFFVMLETTPFIQNMKALYFLKLPDKFISLVFFSYRYIYVYLEELRKMKNTLKLRGYRNRLSIHGLRIHSRVIGSILLRSFEQADRVCSAMILRGYSGKIFIHSHFSSCASDYLKALITILIIAAIIGIQFIL